MATKQLESTPKDETTASPVLWSGQKAEVRSTSDLSENDKPLAEVGMEQVDGTDNDAVTTIPMSALELLSATAINVPGEDLFNRDDAVIDALAIDDREKARLQSAYREVGDVLKSEEARATEVTRNADGTFALSVPPMMQARNTARARFAAAVVSSLGKERGEVFLAAKQHSAMFGKEGAPKDYFIEMEAVGDGNFRYRVSEMEGESRRVFVGNAIPTRLRHLTDVAKIVPVLEASEDEDE